MRNFCKILGNVIEALCLLCVLVLIFGLVTAAFAWVAYTFAVWVTGA